MNLLQALVAISNHEDKAKTASFTLDIKEVTRTVVVTKGWVKENNRWEFSLKCTHEPAYRYTEDEIVSGLASISGGIAMHFNQIPYTVSDITYRDR